MAANAVSAAVGFPLRYKFFSLARNAADVDTYIYIHIMTQNLNLLFLFWSVSLATITRRLVEMDRMRKLYIYLTQSDFTWQPRNVLDMQALQRVQLGPGVFKHVAVFL